MTSNTNQLFVPNYTKKRCFFIEAWRFEEAGERCSEAVSERLRRCEKEPLCRLWRELKEEHSAICRVQNFGRNRKKTQKARERFFTKQFQFVKCMSEQPLPTSSTSRGRNLKGIWKTNIQMNVVRSAPGPNGVAYITYKHCPKVLGQFHRIFKSARI